MCESVFSLFARSCQHGSAKRLCILRQSCLCLICFLIGASSWAQTHASSQSLQQSNQANANTDDVENSSQQTIVELTNGDVLMGTIIQQSPQTITLLHPILGAITLPRTYTTTHTTTQTTTTHITGTTNDQSHLVANTDATTLSYAPSQAIKTDRRHQTIAAIQAQAQQDQAEPNQTEPNQTHSNSLDNPTTNPTNGIVQWLKQWGHNLEASFTGTEGVNRSLAFLVGYKANRDSKTDRTNLNTRYYKFENRKDQSNKEKAHFEIQQDWVLENSNWFPFVRGRWDYDLNQNWQNRYQAFGGVGYTLAQNQDMEANLRVAGGITREEHSEDSTRLESLLSAAVVRWQIDDQQSISGSISFYPQIENLNEFRLTTELEYRIKVEAFEGFSVRFGVENEHQSFIEEGSKNDMLFYAGIGYAF